MNGKLVKIKAIFMVKAGAILAKLFRLCYTINGYKL